MSGRHRKTSEMSQIMVFENLNQNTQTLYYDYLGL
jgi:hypothetical protein